MTSPAAARGGEIIATAEIASPIVRSGLDFWEHLRRGRKFPARADVTPRAAKPLLRNLVLLARVGDDYIYRVVGDDVAIAYSPSLRHKRVSEIDALLPGLSAPMKSLLDTVCQEARPLALRNWIELGSPQERMKRREAVILPLGEGAVDHILVVDAPMDQDVNLEEDPPCR